MSLLRQTSEPRALSESGSAIRVGDNQNAQQEQTRWGTMLVWFMRMLAVIWICQGLVEWAKILLPGEPFLAHAASSAAGAAVIFFAVADLLAAVGLWLATPWGGALWLFAAISQIFVVIAMPHFYSVIWAGVDFALIIAYFVLTWRAGYSLPSRRVAGLS